MSFGQQSPNRSTDYGTLLKNPSEYPQLTSKPRNSKSTFNARKRSSKKFMPKHKSIPPVNDVGQRRYCQLRGPQMAIHHHFDSIRVPKPGFKSFDSRTQKYILKDTSHDFHLNIQIDKVKRQIEEVPQVDNTAFVYTKLFSKQQLKTFEFQDPSPRINAQVSVAVEEEEKKTTDYKVWNKLKKNKLRDKIGPNLPSKSCLKTKPK